VVSYEFSIEDQYTFWSEVNNTVIIIKINVNANLWLKHTPICLMKSETKQDIMTS